MTDRLQIVPAPEAGWAAVEAVFATEASARNCWCQFHVLSNAEAAATDRESRRAMLLYYAFYTAQMTDHSLRGAGEVPQGFIDLVSDQIRRAQAEGTAAAGLHPELEAAVLLAVVPGAASGVLTGYGTLEEATLLVDYAVDRIFGPA